MYIAQTIQAIDSGSHLLVRLIMDRTKALTPDLIAAVMSLSQFSWHGRSPRSVRTVSGTKRPTDLDLLSVLHELAKRNAQIELPGYQSCLPWQISAREQHIGTMRFGRIVRLVSHREHLSFSVRIHDESVVDRATGTTGGSERSYMLAGHDGSWHEGWQGFVWQPATDEAAFMTRQKIVDNGAVPFADYLHRNRRQSICGAPYLLLKLLWQRIEDEISFYQAEIKRLEAVGVERPRGLDAGPDPIIIKGPTQNVFVPVFQVELSGLSFTGTYTALPETLGGYLKAYYQLHFLRDRLRSVVQFMMRADEVAFYRFGKADGFTPWWVRESAWQQSSAESATIELGNYLRLTWREREVAKAVAA